MIPLILYCRNCDLTAAFQSFFYQKKMPSNQIKLVKSNTTTIVFLLIFGINNCKAEELGIINKDYRVRRPKLGVVSASASVDEGPALTGRRITGRRGVSGMSTSTDSSE